MKKEFDRRKITKHFTGTTALSNVNFDIKKGKVHAVYGENGAGKSTLMHILAGNYHPSGGRIVPVIFKKMVIKRPVLGKSISLHMAEMMEIWNP